MLFWPYTKDPNDSEYLEGTVPSDWVGNETLSSVTVTPLNGSDLTVGAPAITGNTFRFSVTGGTPGTHLLDIRVDTATRSRNRLTALNVKET